ncbi:MAG: IclR family transcriptional regulator [Pseudomonadota bacterium]|nr:IclR family transcriptional regulator [Pseudomonadota bacterium]
MAGMDGDKPRIQSVARAIDVMLCVSRSQAGLTPSEICAATGLQRQTVYHMIQTLTATGMLMRGSDGKYVLGLKVGAFSEGFGRHLAPPERLAPFAREAANQTGETCYAVGWWEQQIIVLAVASGVNSTPGSSVHHGLYSHAHARASGKLLLSLAGERVRDSYLAHHGMEPLTDKTIVDRARFEEEMATVKAQGFAIDREEYREGLICLAVPIYNGAVPYVIGMSSPKPVFEARGDKLLASLRAVVSSPAENDDKIVASG